MSETPTLTVDTFTDYVPLAVSTALPTGLRPRYIFNGLRSEIGEAYGKFAKYDLKGATPEAFAKMRDGMILELGDICWYIALAVHVKQFAPVLCAGKPVRDHEYSDEERDEWINHDLDYLYRHAASFNWAVLTVNDVRFLVYTVENLAHLIGSDLPEVMSLNVAKLGVRQAENTLIGNGDGAHR